jgi:hypothetical protein
MEEQLSQQPQAEVPQQAPEQSEPVENQEVEQPQEAQPEAEAPTSQAPAEPQAEQAEPVQEPEQVEEEVEDIDSMPYKQPIPPAPVDVNSLPTNPDGTIDPEVFANAVYSQALQAANAQAQQTVQEQLQEQKLWQQAEKSYPELAENKELRNMVHNTRLGEMAASLGEKNPTPKQVADKLFKQINSAKASGVEQATNNVRVQESATLESASNVKPDNRDQVYGAALSGDDNARQEYIKNLIDSGQIVLD